MFAQMQISYFNSFSLHSCQVAGVFSFLTAVPYFPGEYTLKHLWISSDTNWYISRPLFALFEAEDSCCNCLHSFNLINLIRNDKIFVGLIEWTAGLK